MRPLYLICAVALLGASPAGGQTPAPPPAADARGYFVFLRGTPVGREDISVRVEDGVTVITGTGRLSPPLDVVTRRAEVRYGRDWSPRSLEFEGSVRLQEQTLRVTFENGQATVAATVGGKPVPMEPDPVSAQTLVLPNGFFGFHEAVAQRLVTVTPPAELRAYIAPQAEIALHVRSVVNERVQTGARTFEVRRYELAFANPGGDVAFQLTADALGRLIRVTIPGQSIDVVREDVAASTSRTQTYANPGDEAITIPGSGFNIAATLTLPKTAAARHPVVVLVGGGATGDRDGVASGVPILGQLAGALAEAGYAALRYDKRGSGQTGGRAESATLGDFAEDVRSIVRYLDRRRDIDPKRIVVLGHSEGAWIAQLAATREGRIDGVVSLAAPGTTGAELVLEQQRRALEQLQLPDAERQAKVELQRKIQAAVVSSKGWEELPPDLRKQADTPWFQSYLTFDPARVVKDIEQPLLIVHGEIDRQVPVSHAETLAEIARKGDSRSVEVITVRGVNHLLVPAVTGEVAEYDELADRNISRDVTTAIVDWLAKTFKP